MITIASIVVEKLTQIVSMEDISSGDVVVVVRFKFLNDVHCVDALLPSIMKFASMATKLSIPKKTLITQVKCLEFTNVTHSSLKNGFGTM